MWRRRWDLNPRTALTAYTLSRGTSYSHLSTPQCMKHTKVLKPALTLGFCDIHFSISALAVYFLLSAVYYFKPSIISTAALQACFLSSSFTSVYTFKNILGFECPNIFAPTVGETLLLAIAVAKL